MKKTEFFIVGNVKSGTTTMHNLLTLHPEIFLPGKKELTFFCKDIQKSSDKFHGYKKHYTIRDLDDYEAFYKNAKRNQIRGEVTPHYTYSKVAAGEIYRYNKNAKIIIFLREPVSFLRSLHQDFVSCLNESEEDFLKAINLEESRRRGKEIPKTVSYPEALLYSDWVKYKEQIERYEELFGKDNIKVFFLKEIKEDEKIVYRKILEFIGVKNKIFFPNKEVSHNSSRSLRFKKAYQILKNSRFISILKSFIYKRNYGQGKSLFNSILRSIFWETSGKMKISEEDIKILKSKYYNDVLELENYLRENKFIKFSLTEYWEY